MIGKTVYHYHTLQDGEEGHAHEGGDIRHEHSDWGYYKYNRQPRHERFPYAAPLTFNLRRLISEYGWIGVKKALEELRP